MELAEFLANLELTIPPVEAVALGAVEDSCALLIGVAFALHPIAKSRPKLGSIKCNLFIVNERLGARCEY